MSETLIGVIIGGLIASITPIINIIHDHIKWKKGQRIEYLKLKRDRLEKTFKETYGKIVEGINDDNYSTDALSNFEFLFPSKVSEEYEKFIKLEKKDPLKIKFSLYDIMRSMKKELADIEKKIECEII